MSSAKIYVMTKLAPIMAQTYISSVAILEPSSLLLVLGRMTHNQTVPVANSRDKIMLASTTVIALIKNDAVDRLLISVAFALL